MKKKIVILNGYHRSGTSWLGKILDSSPNVNYFFEPFHPNYNFFKGFSNPYTCFKTDETHSNDKNIIKKGIKKMSLQNLFFSETKKIEFYKWLFSFHFLKRLNMYNSLEYAKNRSIVKDSELIKFWK